jgi:hypothetical protein
VLEAIGRKAGPAVVPQHRRSWFTGPAFRYAAVFVGGLLASALLLGPGTRNSVGPDVSELVGTIGGHSVAGRGAPIDQVEIALPQVDGLVNSYQLEGQLAVELDLTASEPIEVIARHGGQSVHVSLGAGPATAAERVIWLPSGEEQAGPDIELEVYGGGRVVHRARLRASRER